MEMGLESAKRGRQTRTRVAAPVTLRTLLLVGACLIATPATALDVTGPARVIDGDTVVVNGTTVRLKGVDAAERGTLRGDNATAVMRTLVNGELTVT